MKQDTVAEVRRAIGEVVVARLDSSTNELQTRYAAIDPMLDALGWSQRDPAQVAVEYSPAKSHVRVDYALLDRGRERVFIGFESMPFKRPETGVIALRVNVQGGGTMKWSGIAEATERCER